MPLTSFDRLVSAAAALAIAAGLVFASSAPLVPLTVLARSAAIA